MGRNINYHIHLIFPNDPLAARPISKSSKNCISVCSLGSEMSTQNKWVHHQVMTGAGVALTSHPAVNELKTSQHPPLSVIG